MDPRQPILSVQWILNDTYGWLEGQKQTPQRACKGLRGAPNWLSDREPLGELCCI